MCARSDTRYESQFSNTRSFSTRLVTPRLIPRRPPVAREPARPRRPDAAPLRRRGRAVKSAAARAPAAGGSGGDGDERGRSSSCAKMPYVPPHLRGGGGGGDASSEAGEREPLARGALRRRTRCWSRRWRKRPWRRWWQRRRWQRQPRRWRQGKGGAAALRRPLVRALLRRSAARPLAARRRGEFLRRVFPRARHARGRAAALLPAPPARVRGPAHGDHCAANRRRRRDQARRALQEPRQEDARRARLDPGRAAARGGVRRRRAPAARRARSSRSSRATTRAATRASRARPT